MKRASALVSLALLAGCSTVNSAAKARTDALLAEAKGGHDEAAPSSWALPEWKPGSWVAYKTVSDANPSYTKTSVLSKDAEGVWLETESWTYQNHSIMKVLYSRRPKSQSEAATLIRRMVSKTDDNPAEVMDFDANPMLRDMMASMMGSMAYAPADAAGATKEDVTVAAGSFAGAAKDSATLQLGPVTKTVTTWFHPAVPVNGLVKSKAADASYAQEVIDYGWTGAASALKE